MSDISVYFYEVLYSDIIDDKILKDSKLNNMSFAGDTMNTFNTAVNKLKFLGKSK